MQKHVIQGQQNFQMASLPDGGCLGSTDSRLINSHAKSIMKLALSPACWALSPPEALPCIVMVNYHLTPLYNIPVT